MSTYDPAISCPSTQHNTSSILLVSLVVRLRILIKIVCSDVQSIGNITLRLDET